MNYTIKNGDCLLLMADVPDDSIDLILCDLPYGTTNCKWDCIIPFAPLWEQYNRIIKPEGAIVLFGNEPFTSKLITSNINNFKYRWDWDKVIPSGVVYAQYRPMQQTEDICVFTKDGGKTVYHPQMIKRAKPITSGGNKSTAIYGGTFTKGEYKKEYDYKYPTTLIEFLKIRQGALHPTQKPILLLEYLINTYTSKGETVLDNCMGSGSTGVACINTNRNFIGFELDQNYFAIAQKRLKEESAQIRFDL